ncbi:hypothetical protein M514_06013 [Trichuris suis]|uniref:Uncharacterized protein n=1 Tax=Trichuris suis TaxID=68888 RepID=A0A085M7A3_9BILA|nr:hypothetical protein M513_06013 [Trichuris suis]KFD70756.1 hypothetical protein M514_06013 [Trichuris suis]
MFLHHPLPSRINFLYCSILTMKRSTPAPFLYIHRIECNLPDVLLPLDEDGLTSASRDLELDSWVEFEMVSSEFSSGSRVKNVGDCLQQFVDGKRNSAFGLPPIKYENIALRNHVFFLRPLCHFFKPLSSSEWLFVFQKYINLISRFLPATSSIGSITSELCTCLRTLVKPLIGKEQQNGNFCKVPDDMLMSYDAKDNYLVHSYSLNSGRFSKKY